MDEAPLTDSRFREPARHRPLVWLLPVLLVTAVVAIVFTTGDGPTPTPPEFGAPAPQMTGAESEPETAASTPVREVSSSGHEAAPPPTEPPKGGPPAIEVLVVDPTGAPVEGAQVEASLETVVVAESVTGADGTGLLEAPDTSNPIVVRARDAANESHRVLTGPGRSVTLVLRPVSTRTVRVLDDRTGAPVDSCVIHAFDPQRWSPNIFGATVGTTAADGTCSLTFPAPRRTFRLEHPRYEVREVDDPTGWLPDGVEMVVRLAPLPVLRVRVEDEEGRDVEAVAFGRSRAHWRYEFVPVTHSTGRVAGRIEHLVPFDEEAGLQARAPGFAATVVDTPDASDPSNDSAVVEVRLSPGEELRGRLLGLDHPERARLVLWGGVTRLIRVDEDGSFREPGLARGARYQLDVDLSTCDAPNLVLGVHVSPDAETVDLGDLRPPTWAAQDVVRGRVLAPDGRPIPGAQISREGEAVRRADGDGRFAHPVRRPVSDLTIRADGFLRAEREARVGEALEVVLEESRPIEGRVVDDRGAPVPLASVMLIPVPDDPGEEPLPPFVKTWCDAQGRFEVHPDHDGPTFVVAEAPGHLMEWPLPRYVLDAPFVVRLNRNARLVVERAAVDLEEPWTVDVSGNLFRPKRVPANTTTMWMEVESGLVECTVLFPGHEPFVERITIPPGETRMLRAVPGNTTQEDDG